MRFLFVFSMALTVIANVAYHFCQKAIHQDANPLVSLFFTYLIAMLITLICIPFFYPGLQIVPAVKGLNWATFALGFGIVGLELGFLLAYRAGWNLSLGALYSNVMVTVLLLPIGVVVFKETLTRRHWAGLALALTGLILLAKK
ncbi:MAG: EamA family transporter [Acidobacteriota bacterium]